MGVKTLDWQLLCMPDSHMHVRLICHTCKQLTFRATHVLVCAFEVVNKVCRAGLRSTFRCQQHAVFRIKA